MKISKKLQPLLTYYKKFSNLAKTKAILEWDMNVNLPPKGAAGRANQLSLLSELITDLWQQEDFKKTLLSAKGETLEEKALLRNLKRDGKFYYQVPKEVIIEFSRATSEGFMLWQEAKANNKFKNFLPSLKRIISLNQIIAEHLGYQKNPYDGLLDLYEPGLTVEKCEHIFSQLQPQLTTLLKKIVKKEGKFLTDNPLLDKDLNFPISDQQQILMFVLKKMGYDLNSGRIDTSTHPFEENLGRDDIRITTRYKLSDFRESLFSAMHEGGHGLYEQGVSQNYTDTPLQSGTSYAIHESQSRFWENQVGRSLEFIKFIIPILQTIYSQQLGKISDENLLKHINTVKPSLIRTESDEVSYILHIILRFELENAVINKKVKAENLPDVWKAKMKKYFGISPKSDREGVLQDIHWSIGAFGYFPSYALGNLYAAQFGYKMKQEINLEESMARGELGTILSWLRENIHQYGSLYTPDELAKKVTGQTLNPQFFLDYLQEKFSKIYSI